MFDIASLIVVLWCLPVLLLIAIPLVVLVFNLMGKLVPSGRTVSGKQYKLQAEGA